MEALTSGWESANGSQHHFRAPAPIEGQCRGESLTNWVVSDANHNSGFISLLRTLNEMMYTKCLGHRGCKTNTNSFLLLEKFHINPSHRKAHVTCITGVTWLKAGPFLPLIYHFIAVRL